MKELWQSVNKLYFFNFALLFGVALSVVLMFSVQFKVEALQEEISKSEAEISAYEDEIQLLEVEWVYLTRPERLRVLSANYLKDNGYALASQIKNEERMEKYYLANYEEVVKQDGEIELAKSDL